MLVRPIQEQLEQQSTALALERPGLGTVSGRLSRTDLQRWLGQPAPAPRDYPDVTGALVDWPDPGAGTPLGTFSDRLWARIPA
jgi:hypothetical protein